MDPELITQLGPPVLPFALENTEPRTVIKVEPPESEIAVDEELIPDIKDTVYCKSETVPEYIFETVFVKTENDPFVANATEGENLNKTEDTSNTTGQGVQGDLKTDKQYSNNLNGISVRRPKPKHPKKRDLVKFCKPRETTSWEELKEKIQVIEAPVILVKPREYRTIAKDTHVCNHCQHTCNRLINLKAHILKLHREATTMYQCPYCLYKSKWTSALRMHIFRMHKDTKCPNNIEDHCSIIHIVSRTKSVPENSSKSWIFQCTYCPTKFPEEHLLKGHLQLHSSTKGIECPICTYRHNKTEILRHLSWHGANSKDSFICPICDLKKRTKENMDDHLKVVHSKAIYEKHDVVCKNKTCNGFCRITIGAE